MNYEMEKRKGRKEGRKERGRGELNLNSKTHGVADAERGERERACGASPRRAEPIPEAET